MTSGKGVPLDVWQRQAVLAAAALLRERFGMSPTDARAKAVHDALLEVVEPKRRTRRLQREMSKAAGGAALTTAPAARVLFGGLCLMAGHAAIVRLRVLARRRHGSPAIGADLRRYLPCNVVTPCGHAPGSNCSRP